MLTVLRLEECKTNEEAAENVQRQLRHDIRGISPVGLNIPEKQLAELVPPRRRKLGMERCFDSRPCAAFRMDSFQVALNLFGFIRTTPNLVPVLFARRSRASADDIENVLCTRTAVSIPSIETMGVHLRIFSALAPASTITLKVLDEGSCVLSKVSKVDGLPALA